MVPHSAFMSQAFDVPFLILWGSDASLSGMLCYGKVAWSESGWHIHTNAWSHELVHILALWICRIKQRKERAALGKTLLASSSRGRLSSFACTQCRPRTAGNPSHFLQPWKLGKPESWFSSREGQVPEPKLQILLWFLFPSTMQVSRMGVGTYKLVGKHETVRHKGL